MTPRDPRLPDPRSIDRQIYNTKQAQCAAILVDVMRDYFAATSVKKNIELIDEARAIIAEHDLNEVEYYEVGILIGGNIHAR